MADITTIGIGVDSQEVRGATKDLEDMARSGNKAAAATQVLTDRQEAFQRTLNKSSKETAAATSEVKKLAAGSDAAATATEAMSVRAIAGAAGIITAMATAAVTVIQLSADFIELGFAVGRYKDIADKTMADPVGLAKLQLSADLAGVSIESVGSALQQMQQTLSRTSEEGRGAGKALRAIGLELETFRAMRPDEQFLALAIALDGYADSGSKVAVVQAIMGRGGAQQIGTLKELAKNQNAVNLITAEMIAESHEAEVAIKKQNYETKQLASVLAVSMLPALSAVQGAMAQLLIEITGVGGAGERLAKSSAIREWSLNIADGIATVVAAAEKAHTYLTAIDKLITATSDKGSIIYERNVLANKRQRGELTDSQYKEQLAAANARNDERERALGDALGAAVEERTPAADSLRATIRAERNFAAAPKADYEDPRLERLKGKQIEFTSAPDAKPKKPQTYKDPQAREYQSLMDSVERFTALQREELEGGQRLTAADRLRVTALEAINSGYVGTSLRRIDNILLSVNEAKAAEDEVAARKRYAASEEQQAKRQQAAVESESSALDKLNERRTAAQRAVEELGLTEAELHSLKLKRMNDEIVFADIDAQMLDQLSEEAGLRRGQVDALRDVMKAEDDLYNQRKTRREDPSVGIDNAFKKYIEDTNALGASMEKLATDSIKGVEEALVDLAMNGKTDIKSLINMMISEFMRLMIIKPLLRDIFGSGGGGGGGLGSLIGSFIGLLGGNPQAMIGNMGAASIVPGMAGGGKPQPGETYLVGEKGPELLTMGSSAGTITPNDKLMGGGKTVNITMAPSIRIDARSDASQVRASVGDAIRDSQKALLEELRAQGVLA